MRLDDYRESDNVQDDRGNNGGFGFGGAPIGAAPVEVRIDDVQALRMSDQAPSNCGIVHKTPHSEPLVSIPTYT